ncbi:MAG: hypothetical protein PHY59_06025 [Methanobacterium sp.]|nr:hypothetical protein [Methanobacterium sp.]
MQKGTGASVKAYFMVNDNWESFRYIHCYVYRLNADVTRGDQIVNDCTLGSFDLRSEKWGYGDYKLCIIYWGSSDGEWHRTYKEVNIHIRDLKALIYPYDLSGYFNINKPLSAIEYGENVNSLFALPVAYNPKTRKYEVLPNKNLHIQLKRYNKYGEKCKVLKNDHLSADGPIYYNINPDLIKSKDYFYEVMIDYHTKYGTYVKDVYNINL